MNYENMIKIAADDITKLRLCDVERVLTQNDAEHLQGLADYIKVNRPDLAQEVNEILEEI